MDRSDRSLVGNVEDSSGGTESDVTLPDLYRSLEVIETALVTRDPDQLSQADARIAWVQAAFAGMDHGADPERVRFALALATLRGHLARSRFQGKEADEAYASALELLPQAGLSTELADRRGANLKTYLGLTCLQGDDAITWQKAALYFDQAIELHHRAGLEDIASRWGLSAAWMNRGDALGRIGGVENWEEKLRSNHLAGELLRDFPLDENPAYRTRVALCAMNQADACLELARRLGQNRSEEVIGYFQAAIDTLRQGAARGVEESRRVLAVALSNLARARFVLGLSDNELPEGEVREALSLLDQGAVDSLDPELVVLALTARATLCQILVQGEDAPPRWIEVSELAEEGLDLARRFIATGGDQRSVDSIMTELFRSGAEAYLHGQPHFLVEYLLEYLDPAKESAFLASRLNCHEIAVETLWAGSAQIQENGFLGMGTEEYERNQEFLTKWYECRERLALIRGTRFEY